MLYCLSFPAAMESDTIISAQNIHVITPCSAEIFPQKATPKHDLWILYDLYFKQIVIKFLLSLNENDVTDGLNAFESSLLTRIEYIKDVNLILLTIMAIKYG